MREISDKVEPVFTKDTKITYDDFLAKMKEQNI